ncbi:uncharacterized protein LOC126562616 [Anopheles maculipalpis]|uniref:uncharacterized protein LOC126562616 n=1 Tax=Anopheles maculipalpis TaxID=1496333 RepID=UPI0021599EFB|nr:uncharacterized protein LOC126562616 [Anopheles maculipalpis]
MATTNNMKSTERNVADHVEALLNTFANQLPTLQGEINSVVTMLKQSNLNSLNSLSTGTCNVPSDIAAELRLAAEAAESKHFFACTQKLNNTSHMLETLMKEAKFTRRKIDSLAMSNVSTSTPEQRQSLHIQCMYMEQAVCLLCALNRAHHEVQLAANALYIHGLQDVTESLHGADHLKESIARLVSIISTKHFKSSLTPIGLQ